MTNATQPVPAPQVEWSGYPDPSDPDNYWIDDATGERVSVETGERSPAPQANPDETVVWCDTHRCPYGEDDCTRGRNCDPYERRLAEVTEPDEEPRRIGEDN